MSKFKRITLGILLLSSLFLLNMYYFLNYEQHRGIFGTKEVIQGFEGRVSVTGVVVDKYENEFYLKLKHESKSKTIKIISSLDVSKGDRVDVLGLLSQGELLPEKFLVKKMWSYYFVFIRSAFAIPIVFFMFFNNWFFDLDEFRFRRKESA